VSPFRVRRYRPADAAAIAAIYVESVTGLGHRGYSPAQVAAWAGNARDAEEVALWAGDGRIVLVATDGHDRPVAFMDVEEDGHIDMMFCSPGWSGKGVASALFGKIQDEARRRGAGRLYAEASEVARPVFSHWGFDLLRRNDFEVKGVAIHNYAMEKTL
jgi:putative acetyltransferase